MEEARIINCSTIAESRGALSYKEGWVWEVCTPPPKIVCKLGLYVPELSDSLLINCSLFYPSKHLVSLQSIVGGNFAKLKQQINILNTAMLTSAAALSEINLVPLTTTFTAPPEHKKTTISYWYVGGQNGQYILCDGSDHVYYQHTQTRPSCYPRGSSMRYRYTTSSLRLYGNGDRHLYYPPRYLSQRIDRKSSIIRNCCWHNRNNGILLPNPVLRHRHPIRYLQPQQKHTSVLLISQQLQLWWVHLMVAKDTTLSNTLWIVAFSNTAIAVHSVFIKYGGRDLTKSASSTMSAMTAQAGILVQTDTTS